MKMNSLKKLLAFSFVVMLVACGPSKEEIAKNKIAAEKEAKEVELNKKIEFAKLNYSNDLKDPASAQFKNLKVLPDGNSICIEINAKNSYGAYTGFKMIWLQLPSQISSDPEAMKLEATVMEASRAMNDAIAEVEGTTLAKKKCI